MGAVQFTRLWCMDGCTVPPQEICLNRNWKCLDERNRAPYALITAPYLAALCQSALQLTTAGQFQESLQQFRLLLQSCIVAVAATAEQEGEVCDLIRRNHSYYCRFID